MSDFALAFLLAGAATLAVPHLNRNSNRARSAVFAVCILLTWRYVAWRFSATLPPLAWRVDSLYPWAFSVIEALANAGWVLGFLTLSRIKDRCAEATAAGAVLAALPDMPRVDILIPTYNEDELILTRTLIGALNVDFPGVRVWVLDDGHRPWLRRLCAEKGAVYVQRPDNRHAKAGNINHALHLLRCDPDPPQFIALFDADFVPRREFLWRTMPLFHDPQVGLVQTPQHFFNHDPIQSNLLLGHVWPDEQRFFFDHVLPSKDAWSATFCCGTSSVIRMRALDEIGGFPTDSVTEDFLVTLEINRNGWRTVYLNEELSAGLAPEGIQEYLTQRGRWCLGLMQIMRSSLGPLSPRRLGLGYRVGLIDAFLYWAASFSFKLLCLLAPIVYWFTGLTVGTASAGELVNHFLPYYAAIMLALHWATGGVIQPVLTDVAHILTMPEALKATAIGLAAPRGRRFKVTAKGGRRDRVVVHWPLLLRFGLLAGLTLAGMLYGSLGDFAPRQLASSLNAIVVFWSVYNVVVLLLAMAVCVELPRQRREERFATSESVRVFGAGAEFVAQLVDISSLGARIAACIPGKPQDVIRLGLDQVGRIDARIVYGNEKYFTVEFAANAEQRSRLIRKIFSRRYSRRIDDVRWQGVAGALLERVLR